MRTGRKIGWRLRRMAALVLAGAMTLGLCAVATTAEDRPAPTTTAQTEPALTVTDIPWKAVGENGVDVVDTTVKQYACSFSTVPTCYEDIAQYELDSPCKTMALLFLALRTWTPEDPDTCAQMLDYLTDTRVARGEGEGSQPFSAYTPWTEFLKDRMLQNDKWRYIGNAYLGGAAPENDYTPNEPFTVTVRQSTYIPFAPATETTPALYQVLVRIAGDDSERYSLFYADEEGSWKVWGDSWQGLLADVQTPYGDTLYPPAYELPQAPARVQAEPTVVVYDVPARVPGVDDRGDPIVIDTTVKQYAFTFSTVPTCYEDMVQYTLDSPYKTMALLILVFRTWTPENPTDCLEMLDYLTNTAVDSGQTDAQGHKLSRRASSYQFWTDFVKDRMMQNNKWRYIGNAYLDGAMPANDYTPTEPITVTVRQSVYDPYKSAGGHATDPSLCQVLCTIPGADSDRYSLFYQDQRGDWRVWGDNWKGLLADVKAPTGDMPWPAEVTRSATPAHVQTVPTVRIVQRPAKAPGVDEHGDPIVIDTTVDEYTFTFSTVPTCYEDIVQYTLDSPYKTMALLFLALRTWTPEDPDTCAQMLDYLTDTRVARGEGEGSQPFSAYTPWTEFLKDRMLQNDKWRYIGNAYLGGAAPENDYTPNEPFTVTVRQSTYIPFAPATETTPALYQVLVRIAGDDSERYSLFYQDQRGDWRVFGDNWKGLLSDVKTPVGELLMPPEPSQASAQTPQTEPAEETDTVTVPVADENGAVVPNQVTRHTYRFSTLPRTADDMAGYASDSPCKAAALLLAALRTWTPEHAAETARMLDGLTHTNAASGVTDNQGHPLAIPFSGHTPWTGFLTDRMENAAFYRFVEDAYFRQEGQDLSVTVQESTRRPYIAATERTPAIYQVLLRPGGADSDRSVLVYRDQRGYWRVWSDSWKGLLANISLITDAHADGSAVRFSATSNAEDFVPYVACYDSDGRMVSVSTGQSAGQGDYTAPLAGDAGKVGIFLLGADVRPLCGKADLEVQQ